MCKDRHIIINSCPDAGYRHVCHSRSLSVFLADEVLAQRLTSICTLRHTERCRCVHLELMWSMYTKGSSTPWAHAY